MKKHMKTPLTTGRPVTPPHRLAPLAGRPAGSPQLVAGLSSLGSPTEGCRRTNQDHGTKVREKTAGTSAFTEHGNLFQAPLGDVPTHLVATFSRKFGKTHWWTLVDRVGFTRNQTC